MVVTLTTLESSAQNIEKSAYTGSDSEPKKYAYIDALRGVAALGIIVHHVPRAYLSDKINAFLLMGAGGVPLFFMLSAFTLFLSYYNRKNTNEKNPICNFYLRRFFRIAPLFYVLVLVSLLLNGTGLQNPNDPSSKVGLLAIVANLTFTLGLHPYWISSIVHNGWSIGTEMLFYLFVPLLYRWVKSVYHAMWFLVFGLIFAKATIFSVAHIIPRFVSAEMTKSGLWNAFLYQFFPSQVPIFALGILLYFLIRAYQNSALDDQLLNRRRLAWPILTLFALLFINGPLQTFSTDGIIPSFISTYTLLYMPFIFALFLNPVKLVVNKVMIYLGKVSYSLYLTHALVIIFLENVLPPFILGRGLLNYALFLGMTLLITVLLSTLTYFFIEKPGQVWGQRIIRKIEG
ncbi:acyltransferase [Hymenobacter sp. NBH84]|uniref:acyltransferase family protein n=1 Tax=Hymenobacter sp. NBH84 TaxID=2596915 RepID=UPI00162A7222|nr:acyltransferase [Hymenobacter sp. NBH84]QNE39483.1 acyltransferase [Hymenobacter sp. NBH84]